ncbi:MAG: YdcF family protein [Rhizobiaceae bacterium]|nr:YdcF family protein [Rhizobiaceae bacterium]
MSMLRDTMATPSQEGAGPARPHRPLLLALRRVAAFAAVCAVGLAVGGFGVFATYIGELSTPADVKPADAIIVVTGGQARLDAGLELLRAGKGRRLLISGVHPDASARDLQAVTGADRSLFSCCVDIDREALDTIGNAEESAKWVRSHDYDSVILVTNNYHMPRTLLEMRRLLENADLRPYAVVNSRLDHGGWITSPEALRVLFTEYAKYLAALARAVIPAHHGPHGLVVAGAAHTYAD